MIEPKVTNGRAICRNCWQAELKETDLVAIVDRTKPKFEDIHGAKRFLVPVEFTTAVRGMQIELKQTRTGEPCYSHSSGVTVHCFGPGEGACSCGERRKTVRVVAKRREFGYGRKGS